MASPAHEAEALRNDPQHPFDIPLSEDLLIQARSRGVGLTEILEELDPSQGDSTLDAFERQLARAGLRIQGTHSDTIDRFFASTESAILFPEYVSRSVRIGMTDFRALNQILATRTRIDSDTYKTLFMDESAQTAADRRLARLAEGAELPCIEIKSSEHTVKIRKYGRYIEVSYEALRRKTIAVVSVFLKAIGYQIQKDKFEEALAVLVDGDGNSNPAAVSNTAADGTLAYADLVDFALSFHPYQMNVIIAPPAVVKTILTLDEFKDPSTGMNFQATGDLVTPFGAQIIPNSAVAANTLIGLDRRYALEEVFETGLLVESDRLIRRQLEGTAISEVAGFARIIQPAARVLDIDWA
ncbi:MAG: phage major capsid protein [Candidatus Omnitrophica bacterium]|nr:phage major capsid protein [Candidatus Omnitrophota bacterium]